MLNENGTFSTSLRAVYTIPVGKKIAFLYIFILFEIKEN